MNRLTQGLAELCRARLLDEKWVLAPTIRVAHAWLEGVTRGGCPVANAHAKTLKSLALELAAPEMSARGVKLASPRVGAMLVDGAFRQAQQLGLAYLEKLEAGQRLAETIHRSLEAMRLAGLDVESIPPGQFEVETKGRELLWILGRYLAQLREHRLIDYAEVLQTAIRRVQSDPAALPRDVLVVWPSDLHSIALERQLLDTLPAGRKQCLPVDEPVKDGERSDAASDLERLRWLPRPSGAPAAVGDGSVRIFRAIGEVNEVREVLRRCSCEAIPLDEVELLHTDAEIFVPIVYEIMASLSPEGEEDNLPLTLTDGLPCRYARPGRALAAWIALVGENYPQDRFVKMIREGLVCLRCDDEAESASNFVRLAALLGGIGIGFGRDRYLPRIDEQVTAAKKRLERTARITVEDAEDDHEASQARLQRQIQELQSLRALVAAILDACPASDASVVTILDTARKFLNSHARRVNKLDNFARERLVNELNDMRHWLEATGGEVSLDVWRWLAALPVEARVLGSGPRPGCLHVAPALGGGHSGRRHTFVVGLDDGRFPGAGSQDPLLLDVERRTISDELPTSAGEMEQRLADFARLVARLRGTITLSYPCHDLANDREAFPSSVLLAAWRITAGKPEGTQQDLVKHLPQPASFGPLEAEHALGPTEWWLAKLCNEHVPDGVDLVGQCFPHLAQGRLALTHRLSERFTEYDGCVEQAGKDLDPTADRGPVLSAWRLEMLGRCPLCYFFHSGLGVRPPEELAIDPEVWLDPPTMGSLLHRVFEEFFRDLLREARPPRFPDDWPRLQGLLQSRIAAYRDLFPPPTENAFRVQAGQLIEASRIFLAEEADFCRQTNSTPVYLEASLGMRCDGDGTPLDCEEPVPLRLRTGTIRVCGRVDRIDRVVADGVESYAIWDYKTGSASRYTDKKKLAEGRVLQPMLYVAMVAHRLKQQKSQAKVAQFGFFFPSPRERGARAQFAPEELKQAEEALEHLVGLVRSGCFVPTDAAEDCTFCDYRGVCGDVQSVTAASKNKLANPVNSALVPFGKLRGYGEA